MRRPLSPLTAALIAGVAVAGLSEARERRELSESHALAADREVRIDFHSGELRVEPGPGGAVGVELSLECKWSSANCEDLLDAVRIDWRETERRLVLEIEGIRSWQRPQIEVEAIVTLPSSAPLEIDMVAGRLEVESHAADLRVDMTAGEARLQLSERAVRSVYVDVGVGEAKLHGPGAWVSGRRSLLVGSELYWDEGPGDARVDVEMVAGEASIWLE